MLALLPLAIVLPGSALAASAVAASAVAASAGAASASPIELAQAWSRPTPPGATGIAYLVISNHGAKADRLTGASTPVAGSAEINATRLRGGIARMRAVDTLDIPAGGALRLQPGGFHIMLMELSRPLVPGTRFPLTLRFRDAGAVTVQVDVREQS